MHFLRCFLGTSLLLLAVGASAQSAVRMHVPYLPDSPGSWQTFIRLVGAADVTTTFTFRLFTQDGTAAGSYRYRVGRTSWGAARHVNGDQFKALGARSGPWSAFIDMSPRGPSTPAVYLRTAAGFVTPIHNTGEWLTRAEARLFSERVGVPITYGEYQWTLNPGRNTQQVGILHIAALGRPIEVFIFAYDDTGERRALARTGDIPAYARRGYTSAELERASGVVAVGKWRLILVGTGDFSSQTGIFSTAVNIYAASSPQTTNTWEVSASYNDLAAEASVPEGELFAVQVSPPRASSRSRLPRSAAHGQPSESSPQSTVPERRGGHDRGHDIDELLASVRASFQGVTPADIPVLDPLGLD